MPKHLLWGLLFLKVYGTEDVLSDVVGMKRNTFRKWAWKIVEVLDNMEAEEVSRVYVLFVVIYFFLASHKLILRLFYTTPMTGM
jgi:hypothetical protein